MVDGVHTSETLVIVGATAVTVIFADPEMLVYPAWADWAVQFAVPAPEGVNTPPAVIVPPVAVQVTAELYGPVPVTVAAQVEVCAVVIEGGVATTVIPVTVDGEPVIAILAEPDTFVYPA
jgi:hypothetical protein